MSLYPGEREKENMMSTWKWESRKRNSGEFYLAFEFSCHATLSLPHKFLPSLATVWKMEMKQLLVPDSMSSSWGKTFRLQRAGIRGNGGFSQENVWFGGSGRGSVMDTWSAAVLGEGACRLQGGAGQWVAGCQELCWCQRERWPCQIAEVSSCRL